MIRRRAALMMEAVRTPEMLVIFYQTTQYNFPEDSHYHTYCHENLKSPCGERSFGVPVNRERR
jgi:hypothetical protein